MHRLILLWALAILQLPASAQVRGTPITIPGTGLAIVPPEGMAIAKAGATLIDESGETFINFIQGERRFAMDDDPTWRGVFPKQPERLKGALSGNLFERTRANDGGAWDGWMLSVPRGDKVLTVMAAYTGSSPQAFRRIRDHLLSISWNEAIADPELAMGIRLNPKGLKLVERTYGGLTYNQQGTTGATGPSLLIQSTPVASSKVAAMFPAGCQPMLSAGLGSKSFVSPDIANKGSISYCEGWSKDAQPEMRYAALVRTKAGALLTVMGSAPKSAFAEALPVFRDAIATLQVLPGRAQ